MNCLVILGLFLHSSSIYLCLGQSLIRPSRHINVQHETFAVVNIKPEDMEELTEVITCSEFHPKDCNLLVYATSKGIIRMGDLRDSATCTKYVLPPPPWW